MKVRKRIWTSGGKTRTAWQLDYVDRAGKRHRRSFSTKAEADFERRRIESELYKGIHAPGARQYTVADALDTYLEALRTGTRTTTNRTPRPQTIEDYARQIENYVRPRLASMRLADVDAPAVARFRDWLVAESNAGERSREVALQQLKAALDEAKARGMIGGDSWSGINVARSTPKTEEAADDDDVTPDAIPACDEIRHLIATCWAIAAGDFSTIWKPEYATAKYAGVQGPRGWKQMQQGMQTYAPMLELAALTGVRQGELRALQVRDADLAVAELRVRRSIDRKGRVNPPKSEAAYRRIPLAPRAFEILGPRVEGADRKSWIFSNGAGSPVGKSNLYQRGWVRPLELAGLSRYRFHALRHHFASSLIAAGAGALEVKELLGHTDVATTYNIYGHLLRSDESERRERIALVAAGIERGDREVGN